MDYFLGGRSSAYYEYICKRGNVRVHYCAEQFENDGSLSSSLLKTIKRTMAGEYSRELSVKVFAGQCRLIERGFRQGGSAGYGLRRQLIDQDRNPKEILTRGKHKSIQTDRVILVPGPESETQVVREVYDLFTQDHSTEKDIAAQLNERGLVTDLGRRWTGGVVRQILTNPKYAGANVYNRRSFKLKRKRVANPPEMWIRCDNAFTPIVPLEQFTQALAIIESRHTHLTDEQLLERLRDLLARIGELSGILIDEAEDMPVEHGLSEPFWWSHASVRPHWLHTIARPEIHRDQSRHARVPQKSLLPDPEGSQKSGCRGSRR